MSDMVALVDLGSNAARFTLASIMPGREFRVLREERVRTRLGAGRGGALPAAAIADTVRATRRFLGSTSKHRHAQPRVVAVATAAVREARNAERLLRTLREDAGVDVTVLSGEEEARLGALAARASLPLGDGLVLDLGGGSLQLTRVRHERIEPLASLPLGAVRATGRFLRRDPPAPSQLWALRRESDEYLDGLLPRLGSNGRVVALGGTVRALGRMHVAARGLSRRSVHGLRLTSADVTAMRARLERLPLARRRRVPGLKAERADIIVAGVVVLEQLLVRGRYDALTICERGVRHGILLRETFGDGSET
jgi:exopolyphosphatase/guanosine-5'-triphosphate,3'-diphosphate pyrophosphatase